MSHDRQLPLETDLDDDVRVIVDRPPPTMSFGRHRGKVINRIPAGYLKWCLANCSLTAADRNEIIKTIECHERAKARLERRCPTAPPLGSSGSL